MNDLRITLVADGSSDRVLLRPLEWLLRQHLPGNVNIQPQWADLRSLRDRPHTLAKKIAAAIEHYPCDLLFVHRDAEKEPSANRRAEIEKAVRSARTETPPFVCVVPVRMTEAWLLFDERAIRRAAGNPRGKEHLTIHSTDFESIADPKRVLHGALRAASGLSGRRLKNFSTADAARRVAEGIDDFVPLRRLPAFTELEQDIQDACRPWQLRGDCAPVPIT